MQPQPQCDRRPAELATTDSPLTSRDESDLAPEVLPFVRSLADCNRGHSAVNSMSRREISVEKRLSGEDAEAGKGRATQKHAISSNEAVFANQYGLCSLTRRLQVDAMRK